MLALLPFVRLVEVNHFDATHVERLEAVHARKESEVRLGSVQANASLRSPCDRHLLGMHGANAMASFDQAADIFAGWKTEGRPIEPGGQDHLFAEHDDTPNVLPGTLRHERLILSESEEQVLLLLWAVRRHDHLVPFRRCWRINRVAVSRLRYQDAILSLNSPHGPSS